MIRRIKPLAMIGLVTLACAAVPQTPATGLGSIRGLVKDAGGIPLVGAVIMVVAEPDRAGADSAGTARGVDKVIKKASTDGDGKFVATGISPGRYKIKAEATGFRPVEVAALVKPNKVTVFDSILLRRSGTLAEQTSLNVDSRYASRAARGTIFHYDDQGKDTTLAAAPAAASVPLTDRSSETHGFVHAFTESAPGTGWPASELASDFAVSQQIGRSANIVISGQTGVGEDAAQRLQTFTTANAGDHHRLSVALGYGRFTVSRGGGRSGIGQILLGATDTWQVAGPVLVVYGVEVARYAEGASGTSVLPRFGISVDAGSRTRLFAGLMPGSSVDSESRVDLESGEIVFPEQRVAAISAADEAVVDRSFRMQFGGEQVLSSNSSVEMMAFVDTVSGHGMGLLAIPTDGANLDPQLRVQEQNGTARGIRIVYHRRMGKVFDASVGYAFGQGQRFDSRGLTDPASLFTTGFYQVVSAKIDANFIRSGTKVSTVIRLAPAKAVFAIDPFQGQMTTFDPNLNVLITQALPALGFLPGQWAAIVDLRNLFDQQSGVADERQELIASRFHRLVRIGISVRF
jgi:hypothetical protein